MDWNLSQDANQIVNGLELDLSLYVGQTPTPLIQHPAPLLQHPAPLLQHPAPLLQHPAPIVQQQRFVYPPAQEIAPLRPRRRNAPQTLRAGKTENIPAPFLWAKTKRATVYSLEELRIKQISTISGQMQCKKCERQFDMEYNLREKFQEVGSFVMLNKSEMRDRAPNVWMNPVLPSCKFCGQENCVKPVISSSKKSINWLFLFLGQMLGCLTLAQLKYFCKHTGIHRTGAKDRLLYSSYLCMCTQLGPGMLDQDGQQ